jgi:WD40 repeat protein
MATDMGIPIFAQTGDAENNFSTAEEFESQELKKVVLSFTDADVNVYGGAKSDKIELINFADGTYVQSMSKSTLQIYENKGITSFVDFDNFKINFNGFRDYLHYYKYRDKQKTVNIYLQDDAEIIKFEITTQNGNITVKDLPLKCDYKITTTMGNITLENINTDSNIALESTKESSMELKKVNARAFEINAVTAYATMKESAFTHKLFANIASGSFEYDRVEADFSGFNVELSAPNGTLRVWDTEYTSHFSEINVIELPEPIVPPVTEDEQTKAETEEGESPDVKDNESDTENDTSDTTGEDLEEEEPVQDISSITVTVNEGNIKIY